MTSSRIRRTLKKGLATAGSFLYIEHMKEFIQKIKKDALAYLKSLNWIVLLGIAAFCIVLAIINNIRVDDAKSVDWIGSQEILEKPADIL